jgi:hypothetical protein
MPGLYLKTILPVNLVLYRGKQYLYMFICVFVINNGTNYAFRIKIKSGK